mmetsp:Transcript_31219/g.57885  ORF Transcript_31219/g.57885 Transcript_31219/m.57885 type:complete len:319 (+) Transcript_31219:39-995(+)
MPTITLKDGRLLAYESYGDTSERGTRVIFSHGLADSRLLKHWDDDLTKSLGVHIVSIDQPGVGGSSNIPLEQRTLKGYAEDVRELVGDHLKWTKPFQVAGHSGGGPHALALAHYLGPEMVTGGVLAAPAPPFDAPLDTRNPRDGTYSHFVFANAFIMQVIFWIFRQLPFLAYGLCRILVWYGTRDIAAYTKAVALSDRTNSNPETFLGDPKQTKVFEDSFSAGICQGTAGLMGMIHVTMLIPSWGFDIRCDIDPSQHFDVFVSDLDSLFKPHLGELWCKALPNTNWHLWENAGHYSFVDRICWIEFWTKVKSNNKVNN